ncbi:2Fe-2S iron-sulfur cluster-binding protein [Thalassobacillus devorans]|uniref:2Fe-2S iron-sulfur cluster-binding protein n=1 Tax=Thalassobacillus devorans TaxID=279813 RepID=UPI000A1C9264|nr:2Fe-2S iron-sulfur cluster-binding protein [Thalassobacillus devorans]
MSQLVVKIDRSEMRTDQYEIDLKTGRTVLEAVEAIYNHHDPSLAYRYSCRTGLCTTCMMLINGKPGLSCMKMAEPGEDGVLHLAPLPKGRTIKDLIKEV